MSADVDALVERADTAAAPEGDATIATYTVLYDDSQPVRAAVVADRADGTRAVAVNSDASVAAAMTDEKLAKMSVVKRITSETPGAA